MAFFQRNGGLEAAMATLLQNQASFLERSLAMDQRVSELERTISERLTNIEAVLLRHEELLQALPEAIREKIGFKCAAT